MAETGLTTTEAARQLGVNRVTMYDWFSKGCPRGPLDAIAAWRLANVRSDRLEHESRQETVQAMEEIAEPSPEAPKKAPKAAKRSFTLSERRLKADTAKIRAEVAYKLMRNREKRKDLVSLTDVQREAAELAIRVKERLLACPDEMETRFPAETRAANKADFEEFIRQLLLEMSGWRIVGETLDDRIVDAGKAIETKREPK